VECQGVGILRCDAWGDATATWEEVPLRLVGRSATLRQRPPVRGLSGGVWFFAHGLGQGNKAWGSSDTWRIRRIRRSPAQVRLGCCAAILRSRASLPSVPSTDRGWTGLLDESRSARRHHASSPSCANQRGINQVALTDDNQASLDSGWYTFECVRRLRPARVEGVNRYPSKSITATACGMIIDLEIFGCSVPIVTVKPRHLEQKTVSDPGSSNGRTAASEAVYRSSNLCPGATALSSRGLGRRPLTAVTRVRIPLGLPKEPCIHGGFSGTESPKRNRYATMSLETSSFSALDRSA
jgi:hypothetical protein